MALVLNLTDGIETIDFTSANYLLEQDGLLIGFPDHQQETTGTSLLTSGERLAGSKFGNRDIEITFKLKGTSHDDFIAKLQALTRVLDNTRKAAQNGVGNRGVLNYKLDNASTALTFDIIDGDLSLIQFGSPTLRRSNLVLHVKLKLTAHPYARATTPISIMNFLPNPGFDLNAGADDGGYTLQFGGSAGAYLSRSSSLMGAPSAQVPACLMVSTWIAPQAGGATQTIAIMGTTNKAWRLWLDSSNKVNFEWNNTTPTLTTVTSNTAINVAGTYSHIVALIYTTSENDQITLLIINGEVNCVPVESNSPAALRTPSGNFQIAEESGGANHANIHMRGFYIVRDVNILPYQAFHIYRFGQRSLVQGLTTAVGRGGATLTEVPLMDKAYWGLTTANFAGAWPMDESAGPVLDASGNNRSLAVNGSVTFAAGIRQQPARWNIGSAIGTTHEGIYQESKYGANSYRFVGSQNANRYIDQTTASINDVSGKITVFMWVKRRVGGSDDGIVDTTIGATASNFTVTQTGQWRQFIKTFTHSGTALIRIGRHTTSGSIDCLVDSIAVYPGEPFGAFANWTDVTDNPKPFVGYRRLNPIPDPNNGAPWLPVYGIPGDSPAGCRLKIKSNTTLGSVRIGAVWNHNAHKQLFYLPAAFWVPNRPQGTYNSTLTGSSRQEIRYGMAVTLVDRAYVSLPSLFPFPTEQMGTHKIYWGSELVQNQLFQGRVYTQDRAAVLSGDPVKYPGATDTTRSALYDVGLLSWPPDSAIPTGQKSTSTPRGTGKVLSPQLKIANIGESVVLNIDARASFFLPVDSGSVIMTSSLVDNTRGGLLPDELLIIDTIDKNLLSPGYFGKRVTLPGDTFPTDLVSQAGSDFSMMGDGFYIPPNTEGAFVFILSAWLGNVELFGEFDSTTETLDIEAYIEYSPSYLFV